MSADPEPTGPVTERPALLDTRNGRCAICGSRSPTGATSAAPIACRRRSTAGTSSSSSESNCCPSARSTAWCASSATTASRRSGSRGEPLVRRKLERRSRCLRTMAISTSRSPRTFAASSSRHGSQDAGLRRVTVSLDALDNETFMGMNDVDFPVEKVLEGIRGAARVGLAPVKVNMVVKRGVNDHRSWPWRGTSRAAATSCASSSSWT